jgi:predicted nucleic acid-binding protein
VVAEEAIVVVVTDANVMINFIHIGRLDLLANLPGMRFVVPEQVVAEITDTSQAAALHAALENSELDEMCMTDAEEISRYAELAATLGRGESACLTIAEARGWTVASDERRAFRRTAVARLGEQRLLTTPALMVHAIQARLATVAEADQWKDLLEQRRFRMKFTSFGELL